MASHVTAEAVAVHDRFAYFGLVGVRFPQAWVADPGRSVGPLVEALRRLLLVHWQQQRQVAALLCPVAAAAVPGTLTGTWNQVYSNNYVQTTTEID